MAEGDEDTEKSHEPTQHKLREARKKGDIARSVDVTTAAAYGGFLLAAIAIGAPSIQTVSTSLMVLVDQSSELAPLMFGGQSTSVVGGLLGAVAVGTFGWFLIPAALAILAVLAQRGFVFAPSKLSPKASRINPIKNAQNKFGPSGLFEFGKSFVKLLFYSVLLGVFLTYRMSDMAGAIHSNPKIVGALMASMIIDFMFVVLLIALGIGAVDYLWQHYDHLRKNRMSHKEVRDEFKQQEGDPYLKQERRQRGAQIASEQMMADVPTADVVIVNPTHYAVALKWSKAPGSAPVCVAKGVDHIAHAIRELAMENGVPVRRDPPAARAIHAGTKIGEEIDPAQYRPVAAAIRFAEAMRRKARSYGT